ncbi:pirin family protein [Mucilaginibacter gynuensis]|uniref:Pirin family protein n=1 Tax=Mucilaginibacter gynuensis TaxID=1302236 RepID=A0ABP8G9D1_9SPHI
MAKSIIHKAATRGFANLGWLKSYHTFSFSGYYNPERIQFGALRVLNDDTVDGGRGFGDHPHDNMEIISIPLSGELKHRDSMDNEAVIKPGEIQAMSAGTGIYHTEFNNNPNQAVKFLQIWLYPNKRNVQPRYDQVAINTTEKNVLHQILSPNADDAGVWIHQDAWFHTGQLTADTTATYNIKKNGNGVYVFVISGDVTVNGQSLNERDGMGIWDIDALEIKADSDVQVLLMDVPMVVNV